MLVVRALDDAPAKGIQKGDEFRLYVVDAHHHMGREKTHTNTPSGAYEFYALLWFELQRMAKEMMEKDNLLFEPIETIAPNFPRKMFANKEKWARINHGWMVDRTIVFPYTDDYSKSKSIEEPSFRVSNDKIAGWTTRAPHSTRLIGFARVDPKDSLDGNPNRPIKELDRAIMDLGLRGLKLHPLAQLFIDDIEADYTKNVVVRAGELGIPVILDTRNVRAAQRIKDLVDAIRNDETCKSAMRGLKIILAHCAMSPGSSQLYEILRDPVIYGETSTLHDKDVPVLFKMANERLASSNLIWSENLLFGTDYSFLSVQAAELILYMLSRDFLGSLQDVQRILGGNALSLVNRPFKTKAGEHMAPKTVVCYDCGPPAVRTLEDTILKLIDSKDWDILSLDYMIPPKHTWPAIDPVRIGGHNGVDFDSYILALGTRSGSKEMHLWIRRGPQDSISCTVLGTKGSVIIESTEFAVQKMTPSFTKGVHLNSIQTSTAIDLTKEVLKLLR